MNHVLDSSDGEGRFAVGLMAPARPGLIYLAVWHTDHSLWSGICSSTIHLTSILQTLMLAQVTDDQGRR